jgi:hypothetical protein
MEPNATFFFFNFIIRKPLNISFHIFKKIHQSTTTKNVDTNTPIDFKKELILSGGPVGNTSNDGIDIIRNCEKSSNSSQKNKKTNHM